MSLRPFIENVRSNALQRAQLAHELYTRRGEAELLHQALAASGEASAYKDVLGRLEAERVPAREPRSLPAADWRLPSGLPMRLTGTAVVIGLCLFIFAIVYGLESPVPESRPTVARHAVPLPTLRADLPPSVAIETPQTVTPAPEIAEQPPQGLSAGQAVTSDTTSIIEPQAMISIPSPSFTAAPQPTADSATSPSEAAAPESSPAPDGLAAPAPASGPALVTTQMVRPNPVTGTKVVTVVVGRYCQDSSGGQIFTPINAPAPSLSC